MVRVLVALQTPPGELIHPAAPAQPSDVTVAPVLLAADILLLITVLVARDKVPMLVGTQGAADIAATQRAHTDASRQTGTTTAAAQ